MNYELCVESLARRLRPLLQINRGEAWRPVTSAYREGTDNVARPTIVPARRDGLQRLQSANKHTVNWLDEMATNTFAKYIDLYSPTCGSNETTSFDTNGCDVAVRQQKTN